MARIHRRSFATSNKLVLLPSWSLVKWDRTIVKTAEIQALLLLLWHGHRTCSTRTRRRCGCCPAIYRIIRRRFRRPQPPRPIASGSYRRSRGAGSGNARRDPRRCGAARRPGGAARGHRAGDRDVHGRSRYRCDRRRCAAGIIPYAPLMNRSAGRSRFPMLPCSHSG